MFGAVGAAGFAETIGCSHGRRLREDQLADRAPHPAAQWALCGCANISPVRIVRWLVLVARSGAIVSERRLALLFPFAHSVADFLSARHVSATCLLVLGAAKPLRNFVARQGKFEIASYFCDPARFLAEQEGKANGFSDRENALGPSVDLKQRRRSTVRCGAVVRGSLRPSRVSSR